MLERFEVGDLFVLNQLDAVPELEQFRIAHFVHEASSGVRVAAAGSCGR